MPPSSSSRRPTVPTPQSRALWHECEIVGMPRAVVITQLDARDADFAATLADCQAHFGAGIQPLGRAGARLGGCGHVDRRPAARRGARLLRRHPHGAPGRPRARRVLRHLPARAHRGDHRGVRGRRPDGPLPRGRGARLRHPREGPAHRGRARHLPPRAPAVGRDRRRRRRAAARHRGRLPAPRPAPAAHGHPGRGWRRRSRSAPTRTARWSPRSCTPSPTPTSGTSRSCGCSPARCAPTGRCTCPATSSCSACRPARATRPTTTTCGRAPSPPRSTATCSPRPRRSPARSWSSPSSRPRRRPTRSPPPRPRCSSTPWALPEALLPAAVAAATRADEDRMPVAFRELAAEDPSLRIEHDGETGQVVLWTTGPAHLDLVLSRLRVALQRRGRAGAREGRDEGDRARPAPRRRAGTSSSPVATASSPSATW